MNPTLRKIKQQIVDPEIQAIKHTVLGYIAATYYEDRRCDVVYFDNDGAQRKIKRMHMPENGSGLFDQALLPGDRVELSFRNKSSQNMYISKVYKFTNKKNDFRLTKGQDLPNYTGLF